METVEGFQPDGRMLQEIAEAGEIVGEHGADGAGEKERKWNRSQGGGTKEDKEHDQRQNLIDDGHGKEAGEFGLPVG